MLVDHPFESVPVGQAGNRIMGECLIQSVLDLAAGFFFLKVIGLGLYFLFPLTVKPIRKCEGQYERLKPRANLHGVFGEETLRQQAKRQAGGC